MAENVNVRRIEFDTVIHVLPTQNKEINSFISVDSWLRVDCICWKGTSKSQKRFSEWKHFCPEYDEWKAKDQLIHFFCCISEDFAKFLWKFALLLPHTVSHIQYTSLIMYSFEKNLFYGCSHLPIRFVVNIVRL